jgi:class 3 adenylate cyclase/alpha-beta hydrolase superfamily lysophospholipase
MDAKPQIQYARSGDAHIAYFEVGDGPIDVLLIPGMVSNVERLWDHPELEHRLQRLSSFARVIKFDKRGTGLSDHDVSPPSLEQRMEDARAVMDAAGSERAVVWGMSEGGPMAILLAATFPERTVALIAEGTFGRLVRDEEITWGMSAEDLERFADDLAGVWGTGDFLASLGFEDRSLAASYERHSTSPSNAAAIVRLVAQIDIRRILPSITVPTLVMHRRDDRVVSVEHGRYLASRIPDARYVELEGDHVNFTFDPVDELLDVVEEFITGTRRTPTTDRVLTTVLFSDIVDSTARNAAEGDSQWRALLDRHDTAVRLSVEQHRGTVIKTTGDGVLATFDGPARAVRCAADLRERVGTLGLSVRAGVHTGEVEVRRDDVAGIGVVIAARIAAIAGSGEILASRTVKDLVVGSGIDFVDRGTHTLKGVPEDWQVFAAAP